MSWRSRFEENPQAEIAAMCPSDGEEMISTDDMWFVIEDILDSIKIAQQVGDSDIYTTVRDYVGNRYGDD